MAKVFNMIGGFGGGLKPQIIVTAPTGSTVTCDGVAGVEVPIVNPVWRNLPSGYTQLEYIKSTGTQYINTATTQTKMKGFDIKFKFDTIPTNWEAVFGATSSVSNRLYVQGGASSQNYFSIAINNSAINIQTTLDTKEHTVSLDKDTQVVYCDSVQKGTISSMPTNSKSNYLFAVNNTEGLFIGTLRVYHCKLYNANGIIRDFVPCKNSSNEYGMYDLVSNTFFANQGTGSFTGGQEVPQYISSTWTFNASLGTHTIVATLGTKTKTETVLVDEVARYEVTITYPSIPLGATAYFPFTTNYTDIVGGNVGSALAGSPTITSGGKFGDNCLYLNGSSALTIPYNISLNLDTNCTVEYWVKITSVQAGNCFIFGNPVRSGSFTKGYGLYLHSSATTYLTMAYGNGSTEKSSNVFAKSLILDSTWHHLSMNKSGTTYTFYLDGTLVTTLSASISNGATAFLIGKSRDTSQYLTMYMNDLLIVRGRTLRTGNFDVPTEHYVI